MKKKHFGEWGRRGILDLWPLWITVLVLLIIPAIFGMGRITMDSSNESFMPEGDPITEKNREFKEIFGSREFIYLLIETDDLYSTDSLERLRDLERDLRENLPFIDDITSVHSAESMASQGGNLSVESMEEAGIPRDREGQEQFRRRHLDSLLFPGRILTRDGKAGGLMITLRDFPDRAWARTERGYSPFKSEFQVRDRAVLASDIADSPGPTGYWIELNDPRKDVVGTLYALIRDHEAEGFSIRMTGMPYVDFQVDILTERESGFFGLLSIAAASALLLMLFRGFREVIAPLGVFLLTMVYLFGFMGWSGIDMSLLTIVLVPLILVISVGYSIHMINQIRRALARNPADRREALVKAYDHSAWPCFLTAVTTAAGFLSFFFVPILPIRELGLLSAMGTLLAFLLVMVLVPLSYLPGRAGTVEPGVPSEGGRIPWSRWNGGLFRRRELILGGFALASLVLVAGAQRIGVSTDMLEIIGDRAGFVEESRYVADRLGGVYSAEILVELPEADMGKDPRVLKALQEGALIASRYEQVSLTLSLADLVLELDRVLQEKMPGEAVIPENPDLVAQYLLLYEMSGGSTLSDWTDYDYSTLRLSILNGSVGSDFDDLGEEVLSYLRKALPEGTRVSMTGEMPVMLRMMNLLVISQIDSCLAALGFIALLLIMILRSFRLGFLAVIPNLFPILVTLGVMGWCGFKLDFVTAMVAPMLIGIAVDDTMHFFIHFREERAYCGNPREASERTFLSIGDALVATSVVLSGGFILFAFSRMRSLQHMGILAATGIVSALAADLLLSPILLDLSEKRKTFKENRENIHEIL